MNPSLVIKNDLYPLLKLTVPLVLAGVIQSSIFFFETVFLAHLSQEALAAGALVSWLFGTLVVILYGTLGSINILISHKYGANDHSGISLVVRDGLLLSILMTIPIFLLFWNMSSIFLLLGQSPAIVLLAKSYLHALAWGILPNVIIIAFLGFLMGLGHARVIMIFSSLSVSLTIFWSYTLIFGKFGLPALGIAGAGWGMTINYWITAIVLTTYLLFKNNYRTYLYPIFHLGKPSYLWKLFKVGIPMGIMYCIEVAFFFALTLLMGSLGSQLLAANQVALQYMNILSAVVFSIAQAITVRMGHLLGANDFNAAERASYVGVFIAAAFMGIIAICYCLFPSVLISVDFDIHNPNNLAIIHDIEKILAISALFQIFEAIRISLFGALRALTDTYFALLTSIISFWGIALPIGYFLAIYLHLEGAGLWWGMVIGAFFSVLLLYSRFKSRIRRYAPHELAVEGSSK